MTKEQFEALHNVRLMRKDDSRLMRVLGSLLGVLGLKDFMGYWTTIRLPFCGPVIYWPRKILDPMRQTHRSVRVHELVHVDQMTGAWGLAKTYLLYVLFPLPVGLSGRWLVEREAFRAQVADGGMTIERAVRMLWEDYFYPWPRSWMSEWFSNQFNL